MIVADASVVVAALLGQDATAWWAQDALGNEPIVAPHHLPVEVANILRRHALAGAISPDTAALAHADLLRMRVSLHAYAPFARRVWALRANVTAYDACYVAVAEAFDCPLATLDVRLARAPGPRCEFLVPG